MRQAGLTAAGLVFVLAFLAFGCSGKSRVAAHTCSATDRQFINEAQLNMTAIGAWSDEYQSGDVDLGEVVAEARTAELRLAATSPSDPSLRRTRKLMDSMFAEYRKAMLARARNGDASEHMYRAYGLANFARDVLLQAEPALKARGCDVSSLL